MKFYLPGPTLCKAVLLSCFIQFAGCATQRTVSPPDIAPGAVDSFDISGRLSVRYIDPNDKEEALHGRFEWRQRGDRLELALRNPFGQGIAVIESTPAGSALTLSDGRRFEGSSPEELSANVLGWKVPLRGLSHWLEGRAAPHVAASGTDAQEGEVQTGTNGAVESIRQDGWTIRYAYRGTASQPSRIDLSYPGPGAAVELRLAIDRRTRAMPVQTDAANASHDGTGTAEGGTAISHPPTGNTAP